MLRLALLVMLVAACLAGCGRLSGGDSPREQAARKVKDAEQLHEARDYQRAVEAYEEALRLDPAGADSHFKAAVIYDKKLDQFLPAIYHYEMFLKLEPDPEKAKLATEFLDNAQFQYVATLPEFKKLASPDTSRLQAENESLRRQVSDLKTDLIRLRSEKSLSAAPPHIPVARPGASDAPPRKPAPTKSVARTYKVQPGDGLRAIARKVYGDPGQWTRILNANPQIKSPTDLRAGQVLRIP
jgi:nucleoid-associated protein YgaU